MLLEQAQQQQQQHGNNLLAAVGTGNNLQPYWGFPPPPYPTTPHPQAHAVTAGKARGDPQKGNSYFLSFAYQRRVDRLHSGVWQRNVTALYHV
jgi:hypothetical protein